MALRRCKYLGVADGERLIRFRMYECTAPEPVIPKIPASFTMRYGLPLKLERRPVTVDDVCSICQAYEKIKNPT
jgi:hypothetical protein